MAGWALLAGSASVGMRPASQADRMSALSVEVQRTAASVARRSGPG